MDRTNLEKAVNILDNLTQDPNSVKRIKNERGLIERIESSKIVLTEDNKMLLKD